MDRKNHKKLTTVNTIILQADTGGDTFQLCLHLLQQSFHRWGVFAWHGEIIEDGERDWFKKRRVETKQIEKKNSQNHTNWIRPSRTTNVGRGSFIEDVRFIQNTPFSLAAFNARSTSNQNRYNVMCCAKTCRVCLFSLLYFFFFFLSFPLLFACRQCNLRYPYYYLLHSIQYQHTHIINYIVSSWAHDYRIIVAP